jgi:succinoglycan biosynthesis transport protein ExoP
MNYAPAAGQRRPTLAGHTSEWRETLALFGRALRRWVWAIIAFSIMCGGLGVLARYYMPAKYTSTSQLLFDPRGLKIFNNELSSGHFDANAAITFVESQMGVLQSERVLSRVVETECDKLNAAATTQGDGVYKAPNHVFTRFCPREGWKGDWSRALQELRRVLTIRRVERSFVVDITAVAPLPDLAAGLASSIVDAYTREDANTRAQTVARLTGDLAGRLESLRETLQQSEAKVEEYRRDKNLIRVGDKLLIEQRLASATLALNESQTRFDRASARLNQIEAAARSPSALGALGAEADTRALSILIERRNAVLVELAPLAARAGERHPGLIEVRNRLAEVDRSIAAEMSGIRTAARADLARARTEQQNLANTVTELADKATRAKQSEIELRTLEHEVEANRKVLESFETRSREAREFGRLDAANLRIVSMPQQPEVQKLMPKLVMYGMLGLLLGLMVAFASVAIVTLISVMRRRDPPMSEPGVNPAYALQMRAQAFARYRYG